jgi:protein-arginine kinase activator protein McsA
VDILLDTDEKLIAKSPKKLIKMKKQEMDEAVKNLDFETAAILRDEIKVIEQKHR